MPLFPLNARDWRSFKCLGYERKKTKTYPTIVQLNARLSSLKLAPIYDSCVDCIVQCLLAASLTLWVMSAVSAAALETQRRRNNRVEVIAGLQQACELSE